MEPVPWVPNILPVQVVKIGQFAIAVTNFETTTMAGRRIRDTLKTALAGAGVTEVELAAISNAYAQYMTTKEEYLTQNYEGASTLFGPNQLAAVQQELARVAASVADASVPLDVGPTPLQLDRASLVTLQTGVVLDSAPLLRSFSYVRTQPASSYAVGSVASAVFAGAHPKNALTRVSSFCDVQKLGSNGAYSTVLTDAHWDLRYRWERYLIAESKNTCEWNIRAGGRTSVAGTYRFVHRGYSKSLLGTLTAYEGTSSTFTVMAYQNAIVWRLHASCRLGTLDQRHHLDKRDIGTHAWYTYIHRFTTGLTLKLLNLLLPPFNAKKTGDVEFWIERIDFIQTVDHFAITEHLARNQSALGSRIRIFQCSEQEASGVGTEAIPDALVVVEQAYTRGPRRAIAVVTVSNNFLRRHSSTRSSVSSIHGRLLSSSTWSLSESSSAGLESLLTFVSMLKDSD
ncbi:unnamed protein product [Phytophthora lilii]|uniref:Neutral ceramidase n=1 Tax=Phytophthora lilii TaxID=2077276 RepID=A0A9W7CI35_9STRA|nr:unnamed protein product [Phytophthora lilii]